MDGERSKYRLEEVCEFINGFAFKSTDYVPRSNETIEVFRMGYIERGGGFKEDASPVFVRMKYGRNLERFVLKAGDITIAMTDMKDRVAILGNTAWIREDNRFVLNQRVGCIRVKRRDLLDPRFLYFYSNWRPHVDYLRSRANSGVQVNLSTSAITESVIEIPPLDEQRAIAQILGTLDDNIDLNRRMNETLEAVARAIFKSWFVDFDPVRAKARGESPDTICQRLGLTIDLLALFPDRLVGSEFGEIPEGWDVKPLDEIADYLNGLALQKFPPESEFEWFPVIKIAQLKSGSTVGADRASHKLNPDYLVDDGDVLFSWSGSLEVDVWCGGRGALNQHLFKVTSTRYPKWFFFHWTIQHLPHFRTIAAGKAVTMGHIQRRHLTEALCAVPPRELLARADAVIAVILQFQIENRKQSRTISTARDALLSKLLSAEIRVPLEGVR